MLSKSEILERINHIKPDLKERFGLKTIGVFGSYAKDEQTEASDVDVLVEFDKPIGWEFFDVKAIIEQELKKEIDLVTVNALRKELREDILKETIF